jgi:hypothetical protein
VEKDFHPCVQGTRKGARGSKRVAANKIEGQILGCDYFSSFRTLITLIISKVVNINPSLTFPLLYLFGFNGYFSSLLIII